MSKIEMEHECHFHAPPKATNPATAIVFGSVPSVAFSRQLRAESRNCKTVNGAVILQAVAAWMEGREIFDRPEEIWETADRLVGGENPPCDAVRSGDQIPISD